MEINEQNLELIIEKLSMLSDKKGFPSNAKILAMHARHLCKMTYNKEVSNSHIDNGAPMNDIDWIIKKCFEELDHFPEPMEIREIYENFYRSADEKKPVYWEMPK